MRVGSVTPRGRKISVEFHPALAALIDEAAVSHSTAYRRATASDIIREAVARFLLPSEGTNRSIHGTNTTSNGNGCGEVEGEANNG
jgi:hypothetical protein